MYYDALLFYYFNYGRCRQDAIAVADDGRHGGAVYFRHGCGVVVAVGCGKNGNVLVLKKVIRRTAVCPDEIYRVNPRLNLWFLLNQTYICRVVRNS